MRWPGFTEEATLVIPVEARSAREPAQTLRLDGVDFEAKAERHVTVVGRALGARLARAIAARAIDPEALAARFEALDWSYERTGAYLWLRKDKPGGTAQSIVELVDMPAMAAFHFALGRRLGERLAPPPPHITRWVHGDPEGIGVPDEETLRALTVRLVAREEVAPDGAPPR